MKRNEIVKVLECMIDNSFKMSKIYKDRGDMENAEKEIAEMCSLMNAKWLLTDDAYAKEMREIYANI